MYFLYNGVRIFYKRQVGKGIPVLLLHGWGCSHKTLRPVFDFYASLGREIITLDFPPFGESGMPSENFTVQTYADMTAKLLDFLSVKKVDIFAHSFGARVAILLYQKVEVNSLVITGGAGVKPRVNLRKKCKIARYKLRKKLGLKEKKNAGSTDWQSLNPTMRKVFTSVVNAHLDSQLTAIKCPTLLLWGRKDDQTPPYMARKMSKKMASATLVFVENSGHFAFLDDTRVFLAILKAWMEQ